MKKQLFSLLGISIILFCIGIAGSGFLNKSHANETTKIKETIDTFIDGINSLDLETIKTVYSEEATVFYPFSFTPELLKGREEILAKQSKGFELMHQIYANQGKPAPKTLGLSPTDFHIELLSKNIALVNWHSPRPKHLGRRTAILKKVKGQWLIISHHASNMDI